MARAAGASGQRRAGPRRGADQEASLHLPFEQAVRGTTVDLVVIGPGGTTRTLRARIPPDVGDGQTVRLPARGGDGADGGASGDLLVHVRVDPHRWPGATGAT